MEQQDLLVSVTINQNFPGEALLGNTFAILLSRVFWLSLKAGTENVRMGMGNGERGIFKMGNL